MSTKKNKFGAALSLVLPNSAKVLDWRINHDRAKRVLSEKCRREKLKEFFDIPTLTNILNLNDIVDPQEKVKIKYDFIKRNPSIEYWDYVSYFQSTVHKKKLNDTQLNGTTKTMKVSTKGNVIWISNNTVHKYHNTSNAVDHYKIIENKNNIYRLHRVLVSTFIPIPDDLIEIGPTGLFINHKDSIKGNLELDNLEWATPSGNIIHAILSNKLKVPTSVDHYLSIPIVMEVTIDNLLKGEKFIRVGRSNFGIDWGYAPIIRTLAGDVKYAYGCKCRIATEEDFKKYPIGITNSVKEAWLKYPSLFNHRVMPVKLESLTGNETIILIGSKDMVEHGFDSTTVVRSARRNGILHREWRTSFCTIKEAHQWLIDTGKLSQ